MTGVPSFERHYAVESILKKKNIDYALLNGSAQSTLRSVLFDISASFAVRVLRKMGRRNSSVTPPS